MISGKSAGTWRGEVLADARGLEPSTGDGVNKEDAASGAGQLSVVVGTTTDAPDGGERLVVGGRPARHPVRADEAGKDLRYLVVELGQGRLMTLVGSGGGLDLAVLGKVAAPVETDPAALSWLGG